MSRPSLFTDLGVPYTADALASGFVDACGDDRAAIVALIGRVSAQLIADGHPNAWHRFDPGRFFADLGVATEHQRKGMAFRLVGFFHWLWLIGLIEIRHVDRLCQEIHAAAPPAAFIDGFCDALQRQRDLFVGDLPN